MDPFDVVGSEFDVGREAAVERRHQSGPLVAVRQPQRVTELVGRRLEEICAWIELGLEMGTQFEIMFKTEVKC